jgi:transcriptional regulator with XRE-family HTH domain
MEEHPIRRYCRATKTSQHELARRAGISHQLISHFLVGRRVCGARAGLAIVDASGRQIDLEELLRWGRSGR